MYHIKSYYEAKSIKEASRLLKENDNAILIAGGTDLLIKIRNLDERFTNKDLIGICKIDELQGISENDDEIIIKAATDFSTIEKSEIINKYIPILAKASSVVGGPQIRNVGTIGGNICNAAPSADSAASLFALNARLKITDENSSKIIDIKDFYKGVGKNSLNKGEILESIIVNKSQVADFEGIYIKFAQRNTMDIATIGVAVMLKHDGNIIKDIRLAYAVAGPTPLRAYKCEEYARGLSLKHDEIDNICAKVLEETLARDSWRASKVYRDNLIKVLTKRAILEILRNFDEN